MRSFAVSVGRVRTVAVLAGLAAAFLLPAASAVADGEGEDTPPQILFGSVTPSSLPSSGGNVQIQVEIVDDVGIYMTSAQVYGSDGSFQAIQLYEGFSHNYFGTLEVPENTSEGTISYSVEVQAYDSHNAYVNSTIGEVQVEGRPQFDEAPWVTTTEMYPSVLPAEGGPVTIRAEAGDNRGLAGIYALVTGPGGTSTEVAMYALDSSHFEGTFNAPANSGSAAAEYVVEVIAQDDIGQEGRASAGIVTVEAPPPPPPPAEEPWRPGSGPCKKVQKQPHGCEKAREKKPR